MRPFVWLAAAGLGLAVGLGPAQGADKPAKEESGCGHYGTSVDFFASPTHAARRAVKEQKLVFVLHVSGNFENADFT